MLLFSYEMFMEGVYDVWIKVFVDKINLIFSKKA